MLEINLFAIYFTQNVVVGVINCRTNLITRKGGLPFNSFHLASLQDWTLDGSTAAFLLLTRPLRWRSTSMENGWKFLAVE